MEVTNPKLKWLYWLTFQVAGLVLGNTKFDIKELLGWARMLNGSPHVLPGVEDGVSSSQHLPQEHWN